MHVKLPAKKVITFILLVTVYTVNLLIWPYASYSLEDNNDQEPKVTGVKKSLEAKRRATRAKINELKLREKIEVNKLYKSQSKLEATKNDIDYCNVKLKNAKNKLSTLESELNTLSYEQYKSANRASERIKQIYKGERLSLLHLIFASKDLNTFLDRIYYQKRLAVHDKNLLDDLRIKTRRVKATKSGIESQKNNILGTIQEMNTKKKQISASINTSQYLINKLRTDRATYEAAEKDLAKQSASITSMLSKKNKSDDDKLQTKTGFVRPLMGVITSPFGWRKHPIFGSRSFHTGVDIAAANRTPIKASNSGKVVFAGWYGGYGKVVIINHGNYNGKGTSTLYAHLSSSCVNVGEQVKQGQVIGYEGTTGYSTGPHLHFEIRLEGKPTNPMGYIP